MIKKRLRGSEEMRRQSQGFSLIEVLIAIAVLGVVAMALLSFFSSANFYSSHGKDRQKADMAGQSVLEEIGACRTLDDVETHLVTVTGSAWKMINQEEKKSTMRKDVTVDGSDYQARVTLDYEYSTTNTDGDETVSQYNNYSQPELKELYSLHNIVLAETDQLAAAVSHFYYKNTGVSKNTIESGIKRDIILDIKKDTEQPELYRVTASYRYHYNGEDFVAVVKEEKAEAEELKNIYLLYDLLNETVLQEPVTVNSDGLTMEEAKEITLYFICQKNNAAPPAGYQLNVSGSGNYMQFAYVTNGASAPAVSSLRNDIVEHANKKRIATVTVDVYDAEETDYTEENRIVRIRSSKGA